MFLHLEAISPSSGTPLRMPLAPRARGVVACNFSSKACGMSGKSHRRSTDTEGFQQWIQTAFLQSGIEAQLAGPSMHDATPLPLSSTDVINGPQHPFPLGLVVSFSPTILAAAMSKRNPICHPCAERM